MWEWNNKLTNKEYYENHTDSCIKYLIKLFTKLKVFEKIYTKMKDENIDKLLEKLRGGWRESNENDENWALI